MIDKLIAFLQSIESNNALKKSNESISQTKSVDRSFSFLIVFIVSVVIWKVANGGMNGFTLLGIILGGLFFLGIVGSTLYGVWKRIFSLEFSVLRVFFNTSLPFLVGIILIAMWEQSSGQSLPYGPSWYIYFFGGLYALSPIVNFLKSTSKNQGIFHKLLNLYSRYIVAFLIGLTVFMVLFWVSAIFDDRRYIHWGYTDYGYIDKALGYVEWLWTYTIWEKGGQAGIVSMSTLMQVGFAIFIFFLFSLFAWQVITYAWEPVDEDVGRNIRKSGLWVAILFILIWMSPDWKEVIIKNRINKAENILLFNPRDYEEAAKVWGLKWAMKERYREGELHKRYLSEKKYGADSVYMETYNQNEIDIYNEIKNAGNFRNFKYSMRDKIIANKGGTQMDV